MKTLFIQEGARGQKLRQRLEERGQVVAACWSLADAKAEWQKVPFDLLVVPLIKPGVESLDFCRWIRRQPLGKRAFILLSLPVVGWDKAMAILEAGVDDIWFEDSDDRSTQVKLAIIERQVRRRQEWERLEGTLNTRSQQQVAIAALGQCALAEDLPTVVDLVSRFVMHTLEVEFCGLLELAKDGRSLKCVAGHGWRDGYLGQTFKPLPDSLMGRTLAGEDAVVEDLVRDTRYAARDSCLGDHGVMSGISVAVKGKQGVLGVLGAYSARPRRFSEDDLHFLQGLANVVGAAIDRKRTEAELQAHQQQVQHLQRLESVGQLTAGIAHDYNNVLTIIHGHVTLVLGDPRIPEKAGASLKTALEAVERAAGLTRQLLAFSRKQAMQLEAVDLNSLIRNATKLLDRLLGEKIRLGFEPCASPAIIEADAGMIEQVVMNLAVNARDAMTNGGRLVIKTELAAVDEAHVQRQAEARPGNFVCLSVQDTGCGMDEATLRRIFEPFFTTKEPGKGTGLGLATVFGIIKQHQGWIEVTSQPGAGSTFLIYLPNGTRPVSTPSAPLAQSRPKGGHETVLLVEDEPRLRELTRLLLEELGYKVVEAGSGVQALEAWSQHQGKIDLLLSDLVMPDALTGFDLAQRLKERCPELKVILTSGYDAEKIKDFTAEKSFYFLRKPYRTEALAGAIRQCLGKG